MFRKSAEKRKKPAGYVGIGRKLSRWVILVTMTAFLLIFGIIAYVNYNIQRRHEIAQQLEQQTATASQILILQHMAENIADLLAYDENLKAQLPQASDNVGQQLYKKRMVHNALGGYAHLSDQIEEIMVYLDPVGESKAQTFTSREIRSDFVPENASWFMDFLESGKTQGYTAVHSSEPQQNGYTIDVVSYVMGYYGADYTSGRIGYLVINLDAGYIRNIARVESGLIEGCALVDGSGRVLAGDEAILANLAAAGGVGKTGAEAGKTGAEAGGGNAKSGSGDNAKAAGDGIFEAGSGDVFLIFSDMEAGWRLISQISRTKLLKQCMAVLFPVLVILPLIMLIFLVILRLLIQRMIKPIDRLTDAAVEVGAGNLDMSVDIRTGDEVEILADAFNNMVVNVRTLMSESVEHEKKIQQMNTENLLLQINPHFIYNTMNSIVYMARMEGNPKIADFTTAFISLLQHTLKVRSAAFNQLSDELEAVRAYLYLQEYRYGDKFTYTISCPTDLLECEVPGMLLQPVVENAIFHGIAPKEGKGELKIEIGRKDQNLILQVSDDGVGIDPETLKELMLPDHVQKGGVHKIGIGNVRNRIRVLYGEPYDLKVESVPGEGTVVTAWIPLHIGVSGEKKA